MCDVVCGIVVVFFWGSFCGVACGVLVSVLVNVWCGCCGDNEVSVSGAVRRVECYALCH